MTAAEDLIIPPETLQFKLHQMEIAPGQVSRRFDIALGSVIQPAIDGALDSMVLNAQTAVLARFAGRVKEVRCTPTGREGFRNVLG